MKMNSQVTNKFNRILIPWRYSPNGVFNNGYFVEAIVGLEKSELKSVAGSSANVNMSATFNFAVESLDLNRGQIGGYWSHAVTGNGNGRGSGYAILKFPNAMPNGETWLAGQSLLPVTGK